jgi:coproporphyrinogen III oxidase
MIDLDPQQAAARHWFEALRDRICAEFEAIEREAGSDASFEYTPWDRIDPSGEPGGGGVRGVMTGKVFEKVGVNVSTVGGTFEGDFAKSIHGAGDDPRFFATGISLVAHMTNPHVPAVHMNCRFLNTTKRWFGGGGDLNPPLPIEEDTADFHATMIRRITRGSRSGPRPISTSRTGRSAAASAASSSIIWMAISRPISPSRGTLARHFSMRIRGSCGGG